MLSGRYERALWFWAGSDADSVVCTAHAADLGAERFLHDQHNQPTVADNGPLCPRRCREREELVAVIGHQAVNR